MSKTKIEWADETWNPIIGCSKISEGCLNCYAEKMANRIVGMANGRNDQDLAERYRKVLIGRSWNGKTQLVESALEKKFSGSGKRIFVGSMGDMFHESVKEEWIHKVIDVIQAHPQHIFMFLTKRPDNYDVLMKLCWQQPPNIWLGVTAENQEQADRRVSVLLQKQAVKHFVSIEPMLGPVDLENLPSISGIGRHLDALSTAGNYGSDIEGSLDWVICGGESGRNARGMQYKWVADLRDQCKGARVPFFFKQWGDNPYSDCFQESTGINARFGHKKNGKLLDGQEYTEVPE